MKKDYNKIIKIRKLLKDKYTISGFVFLESKEKSVLFFEVLSSYISEAFLENGKLKVKRIYKIETKKPNYYYAILIRNFLKDYLSTGYTYITSSENSVFIYHSGIIERIYIEDKAIYNEPIFLLI